MSGGRWTVCDIAEDFYSALKKEGVELTPQQVLDIQALSLDAMGDFEDGTRIHGAPVVVGGAAFWPITIAASMWREEVEALLSEKDYTTRLYVMAYAMANGHDKDALSVSGRAALKAVRKWARSLTCSMADLLDAVNAVMDDKPRVALPRNLEDKDEDDGLSTPEYLARTAMAIYGTDPDIWLYQLSMPAVLDIILRHHALSSTRKGRLSKRKTEAMRKLAYYVDCIRKKRDHEAD